MIACPVISVKGLAKRFADVAAIDQLNFECAKGEIFGFVGPDGSGKSTIMRLLAGIMSPSAGSIVIEGVDVVRSPESVKGRVSYMPQRFGLYEDLTVDENIEFFANLFEIERDTYEERMTQLLAASGMSLFRQRWAGQLSGGMKQKLGLVCSLVHAPRVLLLDEPTAGVDPVSRRDFWRILYRLRDEGVTVIIATSYLDEAERCTRLGLLHSGRMLHCDTPESLKKLMPGELVSIISSKPRQARAAIAALEGVSRALLVGDGVHVVVDDANLRIPELEGALSSLHIQFERAEKMYPSMEDLFVALISKFEQ